MHNVRSVRQQIVARATLPLLAVCCTLLAVQLVVLLQRPAPHVFGQAVGSPEGGYVLATGQTQSGSKSVLFVLEIASRRLAAYSIENAGIDFKGVREITHDLKPIELKPTKSMSPSEVEKVWKNAQKDQKSP